MNLPIFPTPQWMEINSDSPPVQLSLERVESLHPILLDSRESLEWITRRGIALRDEVRRPGGYLLDLCAAGVFLAGFDMAGWQYGLYSLRQLLDNKTHLRETTIQDYPYKPLRGVHLYMPGRQQIPFFKKLLAWLASLKYNTLFLEVGAGMRFNRHPEINLAWEKFCRAAQAYPGGPIGLQMNSTRYIKDSTHTELGGGSFLEQDEVRELLAYARSLHLEVVPEVQSLSHAYYLCCAHPEIAERPDDPYPDTYCPSNPKSYELYFDVLAEVSEVFQPRLLHVGHDEIYTLGVCPACREKSGNDLLAEDLLKIHAFLKDRGIRMAMWGDTLLPFSLNIWEGGIARRVERSNGASADIPETYRAVERLPRDLLISEWQGNTIPLAMEFFLKEGFEVYCGNFGDNFAAHAYPHWDERSRIPQVLGGQPSTWCDMSEFAMAYNGCLFNMAFSAELLWWSHYRDAERSRLTAQVAALLQQAKEALGDGSLPPTSQVGGALLHIPAAYIRSLPFAPHLRGVCLDEKSPEVRLPVGVPAHSLGFTLLCQARLARKPTWELADPFHQPHEYCLLSITMEYADGHSVRVPLYYGTHAGRWDIPYGEQIDAVPYEAPPKPLGRALTGQPVTGYEWVWRNPQPEKVIAAVQMVYVGAPGGVVWVLEACAEPS